jgi:hypothetical protein
LLAGGIRGGGRESEQFLHADAGFKGREGDVCGLLLGTPEMGRWRRRPAVVAATAVGGGAVALGCQKDRTGSGVRRDMEIAGLGAAALDSSGRLASRPSQASSLPSRASSLVSK